MGTKAVPSFVILIDTYAAVRNGRVLACAVMRRYI
jgi:hypothetical protein